MNKRHIYEAVEQEVKKYRIANNFERGLIWTIYIILWICMFWISYTAIWNREPGYSFFLKFFPAYDINTAVILGAIGIISTCLIALAALPLYIVRTVLGEDRINKKKARIRERYLDIIGE
jgi:hypothetical protein